MTDKIYKFDILWKVGNYDQGESVSFDYLQACLKDVKDDRYESYDLWFEYSGYDSFEVFIRGIRWETDKELEDRMLVDQRAVQAKEAHDRAIYERLKAKFEGKDVK